MMKVNGIRMIDFKGVIGTRLVSFGGNDAEIRGQNGAGKSTVADAYYWLLTDKDYSSASNPNIRPNDNRECIPTVELEIDIDGKIVTIKKMQKKKEKKEENKVSLTNSYEINDVPKSEKDFKKYLEELGVDFELFLPLSHPDAFLKGMNEKKQKEQIRNVLFKMADSTVTDLEIARDGQLKELEKLLGNYSIDEITAMQNATKRKIAENYGKDGEILQARIEGMQSSKVDVDISYIELQRNCLKEKISENSRKLDDLENTSKEYKSLSEELNALEIKVSDIQREANRDIVERKDSLKSYIYNKELELSNCRNLEKSSDIAIKTMETEIENLKAEKERLAEEWKKIYSEEFNKDEAVCPTCHRELPAEKIDELVRTFEETKSKRLKVIEDKGNKAANSIISAKDGMKDSITKKTEYSVKAEVLTKEIELLKKELSELPETIEISETSEYKELQTKIAGTKEKLSGLSNVSEAKRQIAEERDSLNQQLVTIERQLSLAERNVEIDDKISELREQGLRYEQEKADCERILHQIDLLNQRKNELLEESVNAHFKIVKWKLFDFLKNGTYVNDCKPTIDGKDFNSETNGALKTLAKLDIIEGLQKFYNQYYPVFIDDFSLVTQNTEDRINMDCQLIKLIADRNCKELVVLN